MTAFGGVVTPADTWPTPADTFWRTLHDCVPKPPVAGLSPLDRKMGLARRLLYDLIEGNSAYCVMKKDETENLQAVVERITFHSEESGYTVARCQVPRVRELVTNALHTG